MKDFHRLLPAGAFLISALLCACQTNVTTPPDVAASTNAPIPKVDTSGAVRYQVESPASEVRILVYRGGAMARLGHNHVVSSKEITGTLLLHKDLGRSQLTLTLPVGGLVVDDPAARAKEGADFAAEVPRDARDGTRGNLLREEVLDAARHASISLRSTKIVGTRANPEITMRIGIKGVERDVVVAAIVREAGARLTASGEFAIKQSDFGIKPFSVALGALQVQDTLKIKFSIVCVQQK